MAMIYSSTVFLGYMQKGTTSTSPSILNIIALPSMTGKPATGPMFPKPKIAVPSVTIVQIFAVFEYTPSYWTSIFNAYCVK